MKGDTYKETDTPSGIDRVQRLDTGAPDGRGFGAGIPEHDLATGPVTLRGDSVVTRYAESTYGSGYESGTA